MRYFARAVTIRLATQIMAANAIAQGARNATATPIIRKLHDRGCALRRVVAKSQQSRLLRNNVALAINLIDKSVGALLRRFALRAILPLHADVLDFQRSLRDCMSAL
jgi:hypothetical protein